MECCRKEKPEHCRLSVNEQELERVENFKYLGSKLSKYKSVEGEEGEKWREGWRIAEAFKSKTRERDVRMEVMKTLHD